MTSYQSYDSENNDSAFDVLSQESINEIDDSNIDDTLTPLTIGGKYFNTRGVTNKKVIDTIKYSDTFLKKRNILWIKISILHQ